MAYATLDELQADIVDELKIELTSLGDVIPNDAVIGLKVKDAIRETKRERKYPDNYTDEQILRDLEKFFPNIKAKAIYKGNLIGAEYQNSMSENGIMRTWIDYERLSNGVLPIARIAR